MSYENIIVERKDGVAVITLNRPKAMNALSAGLVSELKDALIALDADDEIGCLILTGNEKAFAAGADIKEMQSKSYMDAYMEDFITATWEQIAKLRKPTPPR
jgi:enoyl-CoA hydratase